MPDRDGFLIAKVDDAQHLVFGYANVSVTKRGTLVEDLQNDIIPPDELEKAAYQFVLHFRDSDEMHQGPVIGKLVESMVFTPEKLKRLATDVRTGVVDEQGLAVITKMVPTGWWVGFHIPDSTIFAKVKSGEYAMFSIAGEADKVATV